MEKVPDTQWGRLYFYVTVQYDFISKYTPLYRYNLVDFGLAMHEPECENAWEIEKKNGTVNINNTNLNKTNYGTCLSCNKSRIICLVQIRVVINSNVCFVFVLLSFIID